MESILIVDDDINLCTVLQEELSAVGYNAEFVSDGNKATEFLLQKQVDLILLDLKMPNKDGFGVLKDLQEKNIKSKVIVLTAYADVKSAIDSTKMWANDFISKPYDFYELLITIRRVFQ